MKKKKLLALGMTVVMSLGMLAGCGSSDSASTAEVSSSESSDSAEVAGASKDSDNTLVVALTQSSMVTDYENNYFTNYLEEKLGINIEFYMLPSDASETRTKVNLLATSNEELPDVMVVDNHLTNEMILQLGSSGFFMPLDDYVTDAEKMPNYNAIPEEDRAIMDAASTQADGHIYSLSAYEPETWNLTPNRTYINKAWLDKLGLDVPTTTAELKDVLIAFRDNDPNGNGVQDELGVYGISAGGYGENTVDSLMNAFLFWNGGLGLSEDGNTVIAPFTTDEFKEGLAYMNDLYNEGVLSANIFTDDGQQFKAILNQETPVVGLVSAGSLSNWPDVVNNANFAEMELIEPLKGENGTQYTPYYPYSPGQELMIVEGTDKLDLALKFADEFFDHDTSIIERFGEEGVDWTRDPAELEGHSNAYVEAGLYDSVSMLVTSTVWADNQSQTWRNHGPRYASLEMGNTVYDYSSGNKFDPEDRTQLFGKSYQLYYDKHPENVLPVLKYTLDETAAVQDQLTNVMPYVRQSMAEFITGTRSLDSDWDAYLEALDTMGLQTWLTTAQAAYDRTK
ncbi:MAG: extracellular solute-binding protein [Butyrivibrio sp.]|nr:extracellular solute-binding protein [Butyrivibrio sp.]